MTACHRAVMSSKQEKDGECKLQNWSLSKWNLLSQTRDAGQDSKAVGSTGRCAVCFLLKHLGRLSAAPMERGSSPLRNRAAQTRGVGSTLAPLMEHEPCVLDSSGTRGWALLKKQSEESHQQPQIQAEAERDASEAPGDRCLTSKALHRP